MSRDWWEDLSTHFKTTCGFPLPAVMRDQAQRELQKLNAGSLDQAVEKVMASAAESQKLVDSLSVGLTWFNREYQGISALVSAHHQLRDESGRNTTWLWSVGCSMGQEPYSIAIALLEAGARPIILATDFNREHLHIARRGRYSANKLRLVPEALRAKYFNKTRGGHYVVTPELRECVTFELHNFAIDERSPESWGNFDGIVCRNALIYYDLKEGTRIAKNLCGALRPGGYFLVGSVDRPVLRMLSLPEVSGAGLARVDNPSDLKEIQDGTTPPPAPWKPRSQRAPSSTLKVAQWTSRARPTPPAPVAAKPPVAPTKEEVAGAAAVMQAADKLARARQEDQCLALLQSGVKEFPLAAAVHVMLGISLKRSGDIPGAIAELRAARFLDSNGWLAAYYLAGCLDSDDNSGEARRTYRDTLRLIESKQPACCTEIPGTGDLATLASTIAASCRSRLDQDR